MSDEAVTVVPITRHEAGDLEAFSRAHGRFRWCSCMSWRMPSSDFRHADKEQRAARLAGLEADGTPVGVLAYRHGEPVGWCSVAPRDTYEALNRSRILKPVDSTAVWSVVCMFIDSKHRGRGVARQLLLGAAEYARSMGAPAIEGYPVEPNASYSHMGTAALFESAGFADITPPGRSRRVMRRNLAGNGRR